MAPLVQFKAGRSFRQGDSNQVVSQPDRGLVYLEEEDGLLHFYYKDLSTSSVVEDLIIFPGDASFKAAHRSSRVSVLKFNSSSARHFFWHQDVDLSDEAFDDRIDKVNQLIGGEPDDDARGAMDVESAPSTRDPGIAPSTAPSVPPPPPTTTTGQTRGVPQVSGTQAVQLENILSAFRAASSSSSSSAAGAAAGAGASENSTTQAGGSGLEALQAALRGARSSQAPEYLLQDVLAPSNLVPLLSTLPPSSLSHLSTFLPPSHSSTIPSPSSPSSSSTSTSSGSPLDSVQRAITSPEFRRATTSFDRALRTGATGPVVRSLGMQTGEQGVDEFLSEVLRIVVAQRDAAKDQDNQDNQDKEDSQRGDDMKE
ncbi:hypothetical protein JCM10212_006154 [Sporobolomyces blumeae]